MKCGNCNKNTRLELLNDDVVEIYFCENCGYTSQSNYKKNDDVLVKKLLNSKENQLEFIVYNNESELYWFPFTLITQKISCFLDYNNESQLTWFIVTSGSVLEYELNEFNKCIQFITAFFNNLNMVN